MTLAELPEEPWKTDTYIYNTKRMAVEELFFTIPVILV